MMHKQLVPIYDGKQILPPDTEVEYDGPPNWKFQPMCPEARSVWERETADWEKVERGRKGWARREDHTDAAFENAMVISSQARVIGPKAPMVGTAKLSNGG